MAKMSEANFNSILNVLRSVEDSAGSQFLENAAQDFTTRIYNAYSDSVPLVRMFATARMAELPPWQEDFVKDLAVQKGVDDLVVPDTPVLALVGSSGDKPEWNDRRESRGHVAIPLISSEFLDSIPMMSRLISELGMPLDWLNGREAGIVKPGLGNFSGLFYVENAAESVDLKGRLIISDQAFVGAHNIVTVFGMGGIYHGGDTMVVVIIFAREKVSRSQAERFSMLVNGFKTATLDLSTPDRIFVHNRPGKSRTALVAA